MNSGSNSAQHSALLATMRSLSQQRNLCRDRTTLSHTLCLVVCAPRACCCAPNALSHAMPYHDKLAALAVFVSCRDTDELRRDMGYSYHDKILSLPKIFVSRPSFHNLHIFLLRQGKVLLRHKVPCCLYPRSRRRKTLSRHRIFFHARSLS